jgi:hypothetical protein
MRVRIDAPHARGNRVPAKAMEQRAPKPAAESTAADRLDGWLRFLRRRSPPPRTITRRRLPIEQAGAYERMVGRLLQDATWRRGFEDFTSLISHQVCETPATIVLVSLADSLAASRTALGTAMVLAERRESVLLVDADADQQALSILLGSNDCSRSPGPELPEPVALSLPDISFAKLTGHPMQAAVFADWRVWKRHWQPRYGRVMIDAGPWPARGLEGVLPYADAIFAVVTCGQTRHVWYRDLCQRLQGAGRRLNGCVAMGR